MTAGTIEIAGAAGDRIEAYYAGPSSGGAHGGVVLIHHLPRL